MMEWLWEFSLSIRSFGDLSKTAGITKQSSKADAAQLSSTAGIPQLSSVWLKLQDKHHNSSFTLTCSQHSLLVSDQGPMDLKNIVNILKMLEWFCIYKKERQYEETGECAWHAHDSLWVCASGEVMSCQWGWCRMFQQHTRSDP